MTEQVQSIEKYHEMVTKALERLTRWAFPDSQIERKDERTWQLWHLTEANELCIDVQVELNLKKGVPSSFLISQAAQPEIARLTREDLDEELRVAICSHN